MSVKARRQQKIIEIVETESIVTQDELAKRLKNFGFTTTQTTMSRDIKELRLIKVMSSMGVYRYAVPNTLEFAFVNRLRTIFRESVTTCEAAQNIVVIKTLPGLAMAACSALDSMQIEGLAGTLAGDDTAFLALRTNEDAIELVGKIKQILS